jgi:Tfp pilus assembly protein PilN
MIQFNLLPDVKLQYLKARRTSQLVITVSIIATLVSLAVLVLLLGTVYVFQKKSLDNLNNNVAKYSNQLDSTPNLNKILTVQNQLSVLTSLHNQKAVASRLFTYLEQITPSTASVSQLNVDYTANTISITGDASSLDVVNTYVDTLKFTTYKIAGSSSSSAPDAFSSVVLSSFTINNTDATYTITANFDPTIFNSADNVTLSVPNIISSRSEIEQPTDLFKSHATAESGQ